LGTLVLPFASTRIVPPVLSGTAGNLPEHPYLQLARLALYSKNKCLVLFTPSTTLPWRKLNMDKQDGQDTELKHELITKGVSGCAF
jgi:hypothetical protein